MKVALSSFLARFTQVAFGNLGGITEIARCLKAIMLLAEHARLGLLSIHFNSGRESSRARSAVFQRL
jgi:hypothetical protein